jgi:hypothetical protein
MCWPSLVTFSECRLTLDSSARQNPATHSSRVKRGRDDLLNLSLHASPLLHLLLQQG